MLTRCVVHSGELFTVTEKAQQRNPTLFKKNHRLAEWYESNGKAAAIVIGVATTLVGTILSSYERSSDGESTPGTIVKRGDKIGGFCFGSAVVLLLPARVSVLETVKNGATLQRLLLKLNTLHIKELGLYLGQPLRFQLMVNVPTEFSSTHIASGINSAQAQQNLLDFFYQVKGQKVFKFPENIANFVTPELIKK